MNHESLFGLAIPEEVQVLEELGRQPMRANEYLLARAIELDCLLHFLLHNSLIKEESFNGPIIDLGTGSGIGLLALRKFTLGYLIGVDNQDHHYGGYTGRYEVPTPEVLKMACADFKKKDIYDFLRNWPYESATLITAFYSWVLDWEIGRELNDVMDEIGKVLKPGGQFLFTSNLFTLPTPAWANDGQIVYIEAGNQGMQMLPLVIPVSEDTLKRYGGHIEDIKPYLEPEIFKSAGGQIELARDRRICIFTKK